MLTVDKIEGNYVVKDNDKTILETFEKIKPDKQFDGFYLGYCEDKMGVVLFSRNGEFVYKFQKQKGNIGVSYLIDKILCSEYLIKSMKSVSSLDFWTDVEVVKAFRYRHLEINKARLEKCRDKCKVDVIYEVEKAAIEKFFAIKQSVKLAKSLANTRSSSRLVKAKSQNPNIKK